MRHAATREFTPPPPPAASGSRPPPPGCPPRFLREAGTARGSPRVRRGRRGPPQASVLLEVPGMAKSCSGKTMSWAAGGRSRIHPGRCARWGGPAGRCPTRRDSRPIRCIGTGTGVQARGPPPRSVRPSGGSPPGSPMRSSVPSDCGTAPNPPPGITTPGLINRVTSSLNASGPLAKRVSTLDNSSTAFATPWFIHDRVSITREWTRSRFLSQIGSWWKTRFLNSRSSSKRARILGRLRCSLGMKGNPCGANLGHRAGPLVRPCS